MKILVVGSGGREHALAWKIKQSPLVKELYCAPGNGGMALIAQCVAIKADDIKGLCQFAKEKKIDLTVVGPEAPLVAGIVDVLKKEGLTIFGPTKAAAQLEGSKVFAKKIMAKYGIPTAAFKIFESSNEAKSYVLKLDPPIVIKVDGLAAGKGVILAQSTEQAVQVVSDIIDSKKFGDAGNQIVIEDCIEGEELSVLAFTDGDRIIPLASSQDHKRAYDNDEGPNTGGMGAYSPCPLVSQQDLVTIVEQTIKPVVYGLREEGIIYRGLIYAGLMISKSGPIVLEFNVRFGDPETQAVLPRLKDDIVPLFIEVAQGRLSDHALSWDHRSCINVVMASGGYPGSYQKGYEITGLDAAARQRDAVVFHAGTTVKDNKCITNGGRVLGVSALGDTLKHAKDNAYSALANIHFQDVCYRSDIGAKALQHSI